MKITFLQKFLERFLIYLTMNSFIICLLSIIRDMVLSRDKGIIGVPLMIFTFFIGLVIFAIFLLFFDENSKDINFYRVLTYTVIILLIISFIVSRIVKINSFLCILVTIIQFFLYKKFLNAFYYHDKFENQCFSKDETSLQKELYDYNLNISEAAACYKSNKSIFFAFFLALSFCLFITFVSHIPIFYSTFVWYLIFVVCMLCNFFLYSYYVKEAFYASNGFTNVFDFRIKTFISALIIFILCILCGYALSFNYSLLNYKYFSHIFALFPKHKVSEFTGTPYGRPKELTQEMENLQFMFEEEEESLFSVFLNKFFIFIVILIVLILIYLFLIRPLIKKYFNDVLQKKDLKSIIKAFIKDFIKMIKSVFGNLFKLNRKFKYSPSLQAKNFDSEMQDFLRKSKKSKEKKAELDRLTKQFMKIIDYGTNKGLNYTKDLAPAEYTNKLNNKDADIAGLLFEQALYSADLLTKQQEGDFTNSVNNIVSLMNVE